MKKSVLFIIIILSILSIVFGGYFVYDLIFDVEDNKCISLNENDNSIEDEIDCENNNSSDYLSVSKVREKYFDVNNISKIEFGRSVMGPVYFETKTIDDKETIKEIISEFNVLSFKEFPSRGIGYEGFYIRIVYNDESFIYICEVGTSENEIAILDRREKNYQNDVLINSIIVEFHNGLTFKETFNKYYQ